MPGGKTAMKKYVPWFVLPIILLAGCACSRDLVPDGVLKGLHKPVINKVNPAGIQFNNAGFYLSVVLEKAEDDQYVLYLNEKKVGRAELGYNNNNLGWMISTELIGELLSSAPNGAPFSIRVTGINENYDISGDFNKYHDYVSEPVAFEIQKGKMQFSTARQLFPEWTHSKEPIIRCDSKGNIYLAWLEKINGNYEAFFSSSADAGITWSQVLNISRSMGSVDHVDLAVDGSGHLFLIWGGISTSSVDFSRSMDNGVTWYFPTSISSHDEFARNPAITIDNDGVILLAWRKQVDNVYTEIVLNSSSDCGNTWSRRVLATPDKVNMDWNGELVLTSGAEGELYLVASRNIEDKKGFYFFSSYDHGNTWQMNDVETKNINPFMKYTSARFGNENQLYYVWGDARTSGHYAWNQNCFLRRESSGDWGEIQDLRDICWANDAKTALSVSVEDIHVALTVFGGLLLIHSSDGGRNWSYPETVPGTNCPICTRWPDMVLHPSGKTFLVFASKIDTVDGCLYFMQFE